MSSDELGMANEDVYCTLLMSDSYLPGAAVLAHSLRDCGTKKKIAALVTLDSLLYNSITQLKTIFDYVIPVDKVANPHLENLARLDRLDLRFAFTKIALWKQEQFRKIVYVDSDIVALRAPDELFDLDHNFAAASDIGWPDCFNSGVMVLTPNMGDYWSLQTLANSGTSFDGADQGLFNQYFGNRPWHRLSFAYNCTPSANYQYEPAYRHFRSSITLAHFIGKRKPWQQGRREMNRPESGVYRELLGTWWSVYDRHYKAKQTSSLGQVPPANQHLQQFVVDEDTHSAIAWAAMGKVPTSLSTGARSLSSSLMASTNVPNTTPSTSTPHSFVASQASWDATRSAPPAKSQGEAGSFPSQKYEMSQSTGLFHAPPSYPEPPKDMYYHIPPKPESSEKLKPIFPWEKQAKRPTRVFADSASPQSVQTSEEVSSDTLNQQIKSDSNHAVVTRTNNTSTKEDLDSFSRSNAWDNVTSIDQYVRAVRESQAKTGKVQVLHHDALAEEIGAVSSSDYPDQRMGTTKPRRESLIITDFPTEIERPSLPVTPAPIRRPTFWGEERNEQGELPAAEGVPDQSDWNPHERLEQLRRTSVAAAEELPKQQTNKEPPLRAVPETSADVRSASSPPLKEDPIESYVAEKKDTLGKDSVIT